MTNDPLVLTEGLGKSFGTTRALAELDLSVAAGEAVALLGHNGAGKTTAIRILSTLIQPSAGRATICGFDVVSESSSVREQISLAGQQASLDGRLTGRENLMLLGRLQGLDRAEAKRRTDELLERFGLVDAANRRADRYSGGMRRRLDLAACLLVPRPVIFLDEPTTGLDPVSRADVWETIRGLVLDGVALLLTTQYLDEADRLADRITVLRGGRLAAEGTSAELKDRVGGRRLDVVLGSESDAALAAGELTAVGFALPDGEPSRRFSVPADGGSEDLSRAVAALERAGVVIDEIALARPTLDDVFFSLAGPPSEATDTDSATTIEEAIR